MNIGQPFNPFRMFVGSFIPNALLRDPEISSSAKLVWARLAQYAGESGNAHPRQSTLMAEIGISERCLRMCLHELVRAGLIQVKKAGAGSLKHASDSYVFLWHRIWEESVAGPDRQKLPVPPAKIAGRQYKEVEENQRRESTPLNPPEGGSLPSGPNPQNQDEELLTPGEFGELMGKLSARLARSPVFKGPYPSEKPPG